MKLKIKLTVLFTLFIITGLNAQVKVCADPSCKMLQNFYIEYVTEVSKLPTDFKKIASIKKKYCSVYLIERLKRKELDYDPFLNAQDSEIELLKTLTIKKDLKMANAYNISYLWDEENPPITIKLLVVKEKSDYKINSILGL